jgi:hypothetical protein
MDPLLLGLQILSLQHFLCQSGNSANSVLIIYKFRIGISVPDTPRFQMIKVLVHAQVPVTFYRL